MSLRPITKSLLAPAARIWRADRTTLGKRGLQLLLEIAGKPAAGCRVRRNERENEISSAGDSCVRAQKTRGRETNRAAGGIVPRSCCHYTGRTPNKPGGAGRQNASRGESARWRIIANESSNGWKARPFPNRLGEGSSSSVWLIRTNHPQFCS